MRLLLAGKHELAREALALLLETPGLEVAVATARSESETTSRPTLKGALADRGVRPVASDGRGLHAAVRSLRPDVLVSCGYDRILGADLLASVPWPVNVHFALLPLHRGSYSIPHAILAGDGAIGATLHRMEPGIDDGGILAQTRIADDGTSSCRDLYLAAVAAGRDLIADFIRGLLAGRPPAARPQDEPRATFHGPEFPYGYRIPWRQTASYVASYIRACHFPPYPAAGAAAGAIRFGVEWPARVRFGRPAQPAGTILVEGDAAWVATLNGLVSPVNVRVDGERLPFARFVATHGIAGTRLDC